MRKMKESKIGKTSEKTRTLILGLKEGAFRFQKEVSGRFEPNVRLYAQVLPFPAQVEC